VRAIFHTGDAFDAIFGAGHYNSGAFLFKDVIWTKGNAFTASLTQLF
jgi:hypothetical protein